MRSACKMKRGVQTSLFDVWSGEKRRKDTSSDSRNDDSDGEPTTAASDDEQLMLSDSEDDEMAPVNASTYNGAVSVVDDCCDCTTVCCSKIQQAYPPREKVILSLFLKKGRKFLPAWYKKFPWMTLQRRRRRSGWSGLGRTTFPRVIGLIPRLHRHPRVAKYTCVYDVQLLAIYMMHSAACSSSAFQSSRTHGPIAKTPHHAAPHPCAHARVIFYLQWPDHF